MHLRALGWNSFFEEHWNAQPRQDLLAARVVEGQGQSYRVIAESGEWTAGITGSFRRRATGPSAFPAVGDWAAVQALAGESRALIHDVLPRRTTLSRQAAGVRLEEQVIVANADTVMIVTSLNGDLSVRRLERYLATVWESGAQPVVVLSKMDLCSDPQAVVRQISLVAPGAWVHAISASTGDGMEELTPYLGEGSTVVLVGSSGVGKSTIINRLLQEEIQITREVRGADDRGQHATTSRRLFLLPVGGVLIDTPGLRELQLWQAGGLEAAFGEIEQLAKACRFADCAHQAEPGCAVLSAAAAGTLAPDRLDSFNKLRRELQHLDSRRDPAAQAEQRKRWKQVTKAMRQQKKFKP